jgi:hypothetical protein
MHTDDPNIEPEIDAATGLPRKATTYMALDLDADEGDGEVDAKRRAAAKKNAAQGTDNGATNSAPGGDPTAGLTQLDVDYKPSKAMVDRVAQVAAAAAACCCRGMSFTDCCLR